MAQAKQSASGSTAMARRRLRVRDLDQTEESPEYMLEEVNGRSTRLTTRIICTYYSTKMRILNSPRRPETLINHFQSFSASSNVRQIETPLRRSTDTFIVI